jgi:GntR family transcriptional regulator, transcriptional repressor for pyruvate dehydrogenase complex
MSSESPYRVLKREASLADRATEQIQSLIVQRHLSPGDQLPSERELGEELGVSRTVVRAALRALSAKGLLEVRAGAGTFVSKPSGDVISELLTILMSHTAEGDVSHAHVHEMRQVLEIAMAGLAAERRVDADLVEMRRCVAELRRPGITDEAYIEADMGFHRAIAKASKNPLFPIVMNSIDDLLLRVRLLVLHWPEAIGEAINFHSRVLAEIESGSVAGARAVMKEHLAQSRDLARRALARQAETEAVGQQLSQPAPQVETGQF